MYVRLCVYVCLCMRVYLRMDTLASLVSSEMEIPPVLNLTTVTLDDVYYLSKSLTVSPPGRVPLEGVDPTLLSQEDVWYINIGSDSHFDYRTVEIPFELAEILPPRNLSECEWRSIGLTQSPGWENYHRSGFERNVLLFRRPCTRHTSEASVSMCTHVHTHRQTQPCTHVYTPMHTQSLAQTVTQLNSNPNTPVCEMVNFPMFFWDSESAPKEPAVELHTSKDLLEYQARVLALALN